MPLTSISVISECIWKSKCISETPEVGWRSTKITNIEFIVDPKVLLRGWLIYSYLQIFKLIKCKWLPGDCADWFFDNIMAWSYWLHRWLQHAPAEKEHFD